MKINLEGGKIIFVDTRERRYPESPPPGYYWSFVVTDAEIDLDGGDDVPPTVKKSGSYLLVRVK